MDEGLIEFKEQRIMDHIKRKKNNDELENIEQRTTYNFAEQSLKENEKELEN